MRSDAGFSLVEVIMAIAVVAILLALSAGPFSQWLRKSQLEDRASSLHEAFKSAQTRATTGGEADMANGAIIRQWIYLAVNTDKNSYRVIGWRDANANMIKEPAEFTVLQDGNLGPARYGILPSVTKGVANGEPPFSVSTFSTSACPDATAVPIFDGFQCARFDGNGFLSAPAGNADVYITDGRSNCAVSINRAGIATLYLWCSNEWQVVR